MISFWSDVLYVMLISRMTLLHSIYASGKGSGRILMVSYPSLLSWAWTTSSLWEILQGKEYSKEKQSCLCLPHLRVVVFSIFVYVALFMLLCLSFPFIASSFSLRNSSFSPLPLLGFGMSEENFYNSCSAKFAVFRVLQELGRGNRRGLVLPLSITQYIKNCKIPHYFQVEMPKKKPSLAVKCNYNKWKEAHVVNKS